MARALDPTIARVLKEYDETPKEALWDCHGTWVVYHKAIERMAARAGIAFDQPVVIEANAANKVAVICVTGTMGDRYEWSFGEACPANNKNAYPFAMAEKRAKDRVVLKLLGLHGLAYSEDESDDFKEPAGNPASRGAGGGVPSTAPASTITPEQATFITMAKKALALADTATDVAEWEERNKPEAVRLGFRRDNEAGVSLRKAINERIAEIELADAPAGQLEAAE